MTSGPIQLTGLLLDQRRLFKGADRSESETPALVFSSDVLAAAAEADRSQPAGFQLPSRLLAENEPDRGEVRGPEQPKAAVRGNGATAELEV